MKLQLGDYLDLLLVLNVILTLILVSGWVSFIIWKGVLKETLSQLEEAANFFYSLVQELNYKESLNGQPTQTN